MSKLKCQICNLDFGFDLTLEIGYLTLLIFILYHIRAKKSTLVFYENLC